MRTMAKRKKQAARDEWPDLLRELRRKLDLTQVEAAERLGVAARTWIAWENAQRVPGRIAQRLLSLAFPGEF